MDPNRLSEWEPVLRSQVAVSLLLLAGLVVITGVLMTWIHRLYRDNRELHREFQEHLKAEGHLGPLLAAVRDVLAINRSGEP